MKLCFAICECVGETSRPEVWWEWDDVDVVEVAGDSGEELEDLGGAFSGFETGIRSSRSLSLSRIRSSRSLSLSLVAIVFPFLFLLLGVGVSLPLRPLQFARNTRTTINWKSNLTNHTKTECLPLQTPSFGIPKSVKVSFCIFIISVTSKLNVIILHSNCHINMKQIDQHNVNMKLLHILRKPQLSHKPYIFIHLHLHKTILRKPFGGKERFLISG